MENSYSKSSLQHKISNNGTHFVQGKDDPLSNMWPVQMTQENKISFNLNMFTCMEC